MSSFSGAKYDFKSVYGFLYTFTPIDENEPGCIENADIILIPIDIASEEYSSEKLMSLFAGLFANVTYRDNIGTPKSIEELREHRFACVSHPGRTRHEEDWLMKYVLARSIVFRSCSIFAVYTAISEGLGIGFLPTSIGLGDGKLVQVMEPSPAWQKDIWISVRRKTADGSKVIAVLNAFRGLAD